MSNNKRTRKPYHCAVLMTSKRVAIQHRDSETVRTAEGKQFWLTQRKTTGAITAEPYAMDDWLPAEIMMFEAELIAAKTIIEWQPPSWINIDSWRVVEIEFDEKALIPHWRVKK